MSIIKGIQKVTMSLCVYIVYVNENVSPYWFREPYIEVKGFPSFEGIQVNLKMSPRQIRKELELVFGIY